MKELLDSYFELLETIYADFGYEEGWQVYPLDDKREVYWSIVEDDQLYWSEKKENHQKLIDQEYDDEGIPDDDVFCEEVKTSRSVEKPIYESKDKKFTMFLVDTNCDFNIFLMIFSNERRMGH